MNFGFVEEGFEPSFFFGQTTLVGHGRKFRVLPERNVGYHGIMEKWSDGVVGTNLEH